METDTKKLYNQKLKWHVIKVSDSSKSEKCVRF